MSKRLAALAAPLVALAALAGPGESPKRTPWTTSHVVGSPEPPPPYKVVNAFPHVHLKKPLVLRQIPGEPRLVVAEHQGKVWSFPHRPDATADVFFDLKADLKTLKEHPTADEIDTVYGIEFHPKFADNRFVYVCYTVKQKGKKNTSDGTRLSRFTVTRTDPPRVEPESEVILLTFLEGGHNGGDLHFGPDGYLYISTGDATDPNPPDLFKTGQDISDLLSSILRIDVDRSENNKPYAVPKDNPFLAEKDARPEVWAFGFRNPWRMSFDKKTGDLWAGDVGWELWEMVHRVERGGNYGWSIMEARQPINVDFPQGPGPIRPPVIELPHTISASVTGGYVYRGTKFPELVGAYVFGDYETKRIWAARIENDRLKSLTDLTDLTVRVAAFGQDAAGELFLVDYDTGIINRLERNDAPDRTAAFPRTLSATGLFASVPEHRVAPGVVPFNPTATQWQDYTTAERFVAMPGDSSILWQPRAVQMQGSMFQRVLAFPENGVLVKTLSLETERGNPASRRRIETQILHTDGTYWYGYSYAWNDAQTDAELVPADGAERVIRVKDVAHPGGVREQTWTFSARAQCLQCHTPWAESALAFNVAQLGHNGQLDAFVESGLLRKSGKPDAYRKVFALTDPTDATADLALRARSYLHVNCGHCHRNGGGGAVDMFLHADIGQDKMKVVDMLPARGGFELADAKIVAPGDPCRSVLYYRMAKFGRGRMPHLGSELPDEAGLALVHDWIRSLAESPAATPDESLESPGAALSLARRLGRGKGDSSLMAKAAALPAGPVRDLFDGYLPQTGERKLGPNPRPAVILGRAGDAAKGRAVLATANLQCLNCHVVGKEGKAVGPELTQIGKTRKPVELLESIVDPSRRIEPQYVNYSVTTHSGRTATGVLVKRDANVVVIRDAQGQDIRLTATDVDKLTPLRTSMMPEGLVRDLTAQQAADLVAYLATLR
ncbi:MAG: PQQ-dependent sugar dehydrogenase [Gemmataceae bacterium]